jgi:septal ring factor EnvC (AmiA/AmiB activator)
MNRLIALLGWMFVTTTIGACGFSATAFAQTRAEKAQAEWDRMKGMSETISAPEYVGRNVASDLKAIEQLPAYRKHLADVAKEYSAEIKDDNQPFRNLGIMIQYLRKNLDAFEQSAKQYASLESIKGDLDHVLKMANQAVENEAPAYFRPENDICRSTETAKQRIQYLEALDPKSEEFKSATQLLEETSQQVRTIQQSLSASILEQNELPPDDYRDADREKLLKLLSEKWKKEGTKSKVLRTGIVASSWTRGVSWEIQNRTLYKLDQSRIQGYVIVEHDDQVAVRHSINLVKDHLNKDNVTASFVSDPKEEPELVNQILLSKLK